jgi:hypothetical protein
MSRLNLQDSKTEGMRLGPRTVWESTNTPTGVASLSANSPPLIFVSSGTTAINLPPSSGAGAAQIGQMFLFSNLTAGAIPIQTSAGGAFGTAISLAASSAQRVVCTGSSTANVGWIVA